MRNHVVALAAIFLMGAALAAPAGAQQKIHKRLSPAAKASCAFADGSAMTVSYSSPRMRGRKIYGGLVPYGQVWRLGANEATTFTTAKNVMIGGKEVPAGTYTLFAIPQPDKWTLIINKKTGEWGIPYPGEQYELGRVDMSVSRLPAPVEDLTISFASAGSDAYNMNVDWENTRAAVKITEKK